jgi:hypothetical protein
MLDAVRTARDRMIVTWLSDSGMRIGELCGLWFCDLHLRKDHPCGERKGPHVHVVKRVNPNRASAKTGFPAVVVDGVISGGTIRRASVAMVASYQSISSRITTGSGHSPRRISFWSSSLGSVQARL